METPFFLIDHRLRAISDQAEAEACAAFQRIDAVTEYNQQKVLAAFIESGVSESHFTATTGYGYGDRGRDKLDEVFAKAMGAEDALVRHSILSGTHAIAIALFGILRPGDRMPAATGAPYDTLADVIGMNGPSDGSLREFGVDYRQVELAEDGYPDIAGVTAALEDPAVRLVHIQRSRGYSLRPSLSVAKIGELIAAVKAKRPDVVVFIDNCYGEFAEREEPTAVGADLMAGSLIKNPGGGIAENGGYICGRRDLVEKCAYRHDHSRHWAGRWAPPWAITATLFMGPFSRAPCGGRSDENRRLLRLAVRAAGLRVPPPSREEARADIIQTVRLGTPEALVAFCQGMQRGAPVDAFVTPEPWDMPGYDDPGDHGGGSLYSGGFHRAVGGCTAAGALRSLYAGRPQLSFRENGRAAGGPVHAGKRLFHPLIFVRWRNHLGKFT